MESERERGPSNDHLSVTIFFDYIDFCLCFHTFFYGLSIIMSNRSIITSVIVTPQNISRSLSAIVHSSIVTEPTITTISRIKAIIKTSTNMIRRLPPTLIRCFPQAKRTDQDRSLIRRHSKSSDGCIPALSDDIGIEDTRSRRYGILSASL